MNPTPDMTTALSNSSEVDLQTVLEAWNQATDRLQQTHELLRAEVRRLTDELEAKNHELARKNRLADLGQMASHVAHEVRNGLVPMKLYLSLLRRRIAEDYASATDNTLELLDKTRAGCSALETVVTDLLQFTSHREPQWLDFDIHDLCEEICDGLLPQLEAQHIHVELDFPGESIITADRDMLRRALLNLVLNALDVLPHGGHLQISGHAKSSGYELEIADSGPGLPAEVIARVFEPFFTTKKSGTGLGLAIVERIAEVHGGEVQAHNNSAGGATFTIHLPGSSFTSRTQATRRAA
jgi:signal transduction histidine kinase